MNLMTKMGQTTKYTAQDHLNDLTRYLGREPDCIVVNTSPIPEHIIKWYNDHREEVVVNNLNSGTFRGEVVEGEILDLTEVEKQSGDTLTRSIVRHSAPALSDLLYTIIEK